MKALMVGVVISLIAPMCLAQFNNPEPPPAPVPQVDPAPTPPPVPPPPAPRPGLSDAEINELIQTVMAARLAKELGLNDEQTVLMVRRLSELREQTNLARKKRQEAIRDLRAAIKAGRPDAEIQEKLDNLMAVDQEMFNLRRNAYARAADGLSLVQRAKLYVFFSDFPEEMRKLAQRARQKARALTDPDGPPPLPRRPLPKNAEPEPPMPPPFPADRQP